MLACRDCREAIFRYTHPNGQTCVRCDACLDRRRRLIANKVEAALVEAKELLSRLEKVDTGGAR
jgi:7-cyano-7-deazaguanine synthase in queuosine biosynthesis